MSAGIGAIGGVGAGAGAISGAASVGSIGGAVSAPTIAPSSSAGEAGESSHVTLSRAALGASEIQTAPHAFTAGPAGNYERVAALGAPAASLPSTLQHHHMSLSQLVSMPSFDAIGGPIDPLGKMIDGLTDMLIMMLVIQMMEAVRKASEPNPGGM